MAQDDDNTEMAKTRTDWAEERTILDNERTFSSWMGTGMGAIGVAIGFKSISGDFDPTWAAQLVASNFLFAPIVIFWAARQQALKTDVRFNAKETEVQPTRSFTALATMMTIAPVLKGAPVLTGATLWML